MKIAVIDYNMGNLGSVLKALQFAGAEPEVVSTPGELAHFDRCILPGVGNFGDGMENLNARGFPPVLKRYAAEGKPLFGICLGMQMMLEASEEAPGVAGIGIFPGKVLRFPENGFKIPQIGWNSARFHAGCPLGAGLPEEPYFYFVHSYYVPLTPYAAAETEYILPFASALGAGNCFATQFHPEKSQRVGLQLLRNFLNLPNPERQ